MEILNLKHAMERITGYYDELEQTECEYLEEVAWICIYDHDLLKYGETKD